MSALIVKSLSLAFQVDGSQVIVGRGEPVPAGVDREVIDRYLSLDAIEPASVDALEVEPKSAPVDVSSLDGDALLGWFKGKKLDDLKDAGLSDAQASALLEVEGAKAKPRDAVVELLEELATASAEAGE